MAAGKWLDEIRARAAARGVPVADLARAAGMERSNLRRLLSNTEATPRLGTVMRLLAPLDSWVMPPGARTAGELMMFLDGERGRRGTSWEALLAGSRLAAATFAECLREAPERVPLDVVMHIAGRLEVELTIAEAHDPPAASHEAESGRRPRRRGGSRAPRARSRPAAPRQPELISPAPVASAPPPVDSPPPREQSSASSPWRLCPPRLGRYRDAPPPQRAPAVPTYVPPERTYALELTILQELADMSRGAWRDLFCGLHETITGAMDAPLDLFDELATRTERWFRRLRRPDSEPEPQVQVAVEDVDPTPLVDAWRAMKSDPDRQTTRTVHDWAGRAYVFHPAVSGTHSVQVLLGQGGRPNRLAAIVAVTSDDEQVIASPDLSLELKAGDAVAPFAHYHAGPVFGALRVGNRLYLLGAMSSMLALVEVSKSGARTVWAGFAEDLAKTRLEVVPADSGPAPTSDDSDPGRGAGRDDPQHANLEAELAAARRKLGEERARGAAAQQRADAAAAAQASAERERLALQHRLEAELAAARRALAEERTQRVAAQRRAEETAAALASSEHERLAVQTQLAAEKSMRTAGERAVQASVKELARATLLMMAELTETRRRLAETEQALQDANARRQAAIEPMNVESLNQQPPISELPADGRGGLEEMTTTAADEALQAHVEAAAASASHVESPQSCRVTTSNNDLVEQPDGVVALPDAPGPPDSQSAEREPLSVLAVPAASEPVGVMVYPHADSPPSAEGEMASPSILPATTEVDAALAVNFAVPSVPSAATPGDDPAGDVKDAMDPEVLLVAELSASADAVQSADETPAEACVVETPPDHASADGPALTIEKTNDAASSRTIEANRSPAFEHADEVAPPAAAPAGSRSSPAAAAPMHRMVVATTQDEILADEMVLEEHLVLAVGRWMMKAPGCRVYLDGYLVSDTIRAIAVKAGLGDTPDAAAFDSESGVQVPVAAGDKQAPLAAALSQLQLSAIESSAKRRGPRTVTASKLASVDPPDPSDPPKPRLAKSLTKKWRR